MSFKFNNAVQRLQPLSGHAVRLILWYLADHANDQGVAYASYETLMRACQIKSRTTINEGLKELEALKILRKIHRPNQCVKYVLSLSVIQSLGLAGTNLGKSEVTVGTLDDTPESSQGGSAVRSPILPGISTNERGSTLGDTLSTCNSPVKEIHQEARAKASAPASDHKLTEIEAEAIANILNCIGPQDEQSRAKNLKLLTGFPVGNPALFANQMVWAYRVSNYSGRLNGVRSFMAALPEIATAFEKYHATLRFGKLPPQKCLLNLDQVLGYARHCREEGPEALNPWEFVKNACGENYYQQLMDEAVPVSPDNPEYLRESLDEENADHVIDDEKIPVKDDTLQELRKPTIDKIA